MSDREIEIPVSVLKNLADRFGKDQLIVISWDKQTKEVRGVAYGSDLLQMRKAESGLDFIFSSLRKKRDNK